MTGATFCRRYVEALSSEPALEAAACYRIVLEDDPENPQVRARLDRNGPPG